MGLYTVLCSATFVSFGNWPVEWVVERLTIAIPRKEKESSESRLDRLSVISFIVWILQYSEYPTLQVELILCRLNFSINRPAESCSPPLLCFSREKRP